MGLCVLGVTVSNDGLTLTKPELGHCYIYECLPVS